MLRFHVLARKPIQPKTPERACKPSCRLVERSILTALAIGTLAVPAFSQDAGSAEAEFHGNGVEITVIVHDGSGEPISSGAMVKLYRDGTIPSGQAQTSRGQATFVVNTLGEFNIVVTAPGFSDERKDLSVHATGRAQVDIYLRRSSPRATVSGVPGRPLLSPKAKEAVEKGLLALSQNKTDEAGKYVGKAVELAPGHPDVLYLQGILSLQQRNWLQAQTVLEKATQVDPNHARAFAALGMALCDQGKYDLAIAPLETSLHLDSAASWETHWILAKAYYHQERYDQALEMAERALKSSNGQAPEIGLLVAQSMTAVGRYEESAQVLREFLRSHADRREAATARRWLSQLTASGKIQGTPQ